MAQSPVLMIHGAFCGGWAFDAFRAPFALHIEARECLDDPLLEREHVAPHIGAAPLQVEHRVGDALAGAVIGEAAAAAGGVDRKAFGADEVLAGYIVFLAVLVLRPQGLITRRAQS